LNNISFLAFFSVLSFAIGGAVFNRGKIKFADVL